MIGDAPAEVSVSVNQGVGTTLTVTGVTGGKATKGNTITVNAQLDAGYENLSVTVDDTPVTLPYEITVGTSDIAIASVATKITYKITYKYMCGETEVTEGIENNNANSFTVTDAITIDPEKISVTGYTVKSVTPATIAEGTTDAVTVKVVLESAASKDVKPGEAIEIEADNQADADAIAAKYNVVAVNADAAAAGQVAVLKAVAVKVGEKFVVQTAIDTAAPAYKAPEVAVPAVADSLADIASGEATTVTVNAANVTPGLYYSIDAASEVNGTYLEGGRALATSSGVTLTVTKPAGNKAFFKVSEHMEPTPAN